MKKRFLLSLTLLSVALLAFNPSKANIQPSLRKLSSPYILGPMTNGTISICALRVAFQPDNNDATTGNGRFLTEEVELPCEDAKFPKIDPPPHNNAYFKDHIRALANFYSHASNGHVVIDTNLSGVFPLDDSNFYQLPHKMEYYHPFLKKDSIDIRLAELFIEAVQIADADIDFSKYDVVVVFHAGVGQDFDLFLDPTPYDIPSAYLNSADLAKYFSEIGSSENSISVDNGTVQIDRGLILPESQNHLLYPNWEDVFGGASIPCDYQIGLNGTFAFMMGFYLGLPGLYNTETGETGIGKFGLMDQGSANLNGLVPAYPSAWEREFMGWDTPVIARGFNDVKLNYVESGSDTTLWKIPINDKEYFLLENRYTDVYPGVTLDSIQFRLYVDSGEKDWPPLIPLIVDSIDAEFSAATGVLLSVPRYDVGLPGAGLLIWHIDESVIDANLATNSVNLNKNHRGVDLEEGDGAQDLGYESQMIGATVDVGWYFDPWFAGNEGFWHLNPDYPADDEKRIGFTDFTNPSSKSNDRAYTGIVVDSIGPAGSVMEFRIKNSAYLTGFQIYEPGMLPISEIEMIPIDLDTTDNSNELLVTGKYGQSYIAFTFDNNGNKLTVFPNLRGNNFALSSFGGKQVLINVSKPEPSDTTLFVYVFEIDKSGNVGPSNRQPIPGNQLISNIISLQDGVLVCTFDDKSDSYYLVKYFPDENRSESVKSDYPIYRFSGKDNLVFGDTREGKVLRIDPSTLEYNELGDLINPGTINMGLAYIDENSQADLVVLHSERLYLILNPLADASEIITYGGEFDSTLAFSDIDGDGKVEIITKNSSEIYAFNEKLYLEANFPITIPNQYSDKSFKPHLLTTDIDGDQILDIIVTLEDVGILAYNYSGKLISGYPKALKNSQTDQSTLMDNENGTFLITSNSAGSDITGCYLTDLPLSDDAWYCYGGNSSRSFFYTKSSRSTTSSATGLLNQKKTFNWPNPTKFDRTAIRYFPTAECDISIDIYDLAGDFITSFRDSNPLINDYNEIEWNVSNVANGVYFAVVKASSG
ncbi:MAG TPA: hypothetical protein DHW42_09710, partial [Candidatus Marinimicrobia bacterium]|nr:hypothetical protein [Candidatus Neomarinimicrobiota bacterium]